jgi:hypothetical protein
LTRAANRNVEAVSDAFDGAGPLANVAGFETRGKE